MPVNSRPDGLLVEVFGQFAQSYVAKPQVGSEAVSNPWSRNFDATRDRFALVVPSSAGVALCRRTAAVVGLFEYPRNTDEKAIRTLQEWYKKLADSNGREFNASRYGKESAANFDDGTESAPSHIDEHKTLVFDEYTIDTFVSIGIKQPDGTTEWTPMARFKTISGKRRGSGDIVICRKVLKSEPDTADFLEAVELAIRPHKRREFTVDGYQYPKEPCFVSELPGCDWLAPDLVLLDNSKVHLSNANRCAITTVIGGTVEFGVAHRPKGRGDVENWHSFLAREFRKLASTTATGPGDPRCDRPEEAAVELRLEEDHIDQLLEMLVAKYNVSAKQALKGDSPIEAFQLWARDEDNILRRLPEPSRESFSLMELSFPVTIACDKRSGKQPLVRYQHADYIGAKLAHMRSRRLEECVLTFNPLRAHIARLYSVTDQTELDVLTARGIWSTPHRLCDRKLFTKLKDAGLIDDPKDGESPTDVLRKYLNSSAPQSKKDALALANLNHALGDSKDQQQPTTESTNQEPSSDDENDDDDDITDTMKSKGDW